MKENSINLIDITITMLNDYVSSEKPNKAYFNRMGNETIEKAKDFALPLIDSKDYVKFCLQLDKRYEELVLGLRW